MTKKTLIEVTTLNIEDKLEKIGALRNVAVNDAWKRVRQKIQVKSWSEAEQVIGEMVAGLQKINMSKSMTPLLNTLKTAFKNPEQIVEEIQATPRETPSVTPRETPTVTPRETPKVIEVETDQKPDTQENKEKPLNMQQANELNKVRDGISDLETFLRNTKGKLELEEVPDKFEVPANIQDVFMPCYNIIVSIYEQCQKRQRKTEEVKAQVIDSEARIEELEKLTEVKDEKIHEMSVTIANLEQKNDERKEAKMETFKDQMKMKSLEKNLEQKNTVVDALTKENKDLKDRLNGIAESQSAEQADIGNPYPPLKLVEMYKELFKKEWKDVLEVQKNSHKRKENDAMIRLSGILKDCYIHCKETSEEQLERLMEEFVYPCDNTGAMKGSQKMLFDDSAQRQLNNLRKQTCTVSCEFAKNTLINLLEDSVQTRYTLQEISDCLPFIEKCVELCWFFVLQTPPIVIDLEFDSYKDKAFDKDRFDPFSSAGEKIDFVVWPALYYENNGGIIAKGVAKAK